jgi:hypothetical protein
MDHETSVIDVLQAYIENAGWDFSRIKAEVLRFNRVGDWEEYAFQVTLIPDGTVMLSCPILLNVPMRRRKLVLAKLYELANLVHTKFTIGTFSVDFNQSVKSYYLTWAHRRCVSEVTELHEEQIEHWLDEAFEEIDEMYPSFRDVMLPDVTVEAAYEEAIPPWYGRA